MERQIFICEDTLEGIFTAVYDGWLVEAGHEFVEIRTRQPENMEFFCQYHNVVTDPEKAGKVTRTIKRKLGQETFEYLVYAAASVDQEKGTAIYQTLVQGLCGGCDPRVLERLNHPAVQKINKLKLKVWHEAHRYTGFVRFSEIEGGILFSSIQPENQVLPLIESHFSNRFPLENWIIYDEGRKQALVHASGKEAVLIHGKDLKKEFKNGDQEEEYEKLWKCFCSSIAIKERKNPSLQRQNLPIHFRDQMPEFRRS